MFKTPAFLHTDDAIEVIIQCATKNITYIMNFLFRINLHLKYHNFGFSYVRRVRGPTSRNHVAFAQGAMAVIASTTAAGVRRSLLSDQSRKRTVQGRTCRCDIRFQPSEAKCTH